MLHYLSGRPFSPKSNDDCLLRASVSILLLWAEQVGNTWTVVPKICKSWLKWVYDNRQSSASLARRLCPVRRVCGIGRVFRLAWDSRPGWRGRSPRAVRPRSSSPPAPLWRTPSRIPATYKRQLTQALYYRWSILLCRVHVLNHLKLGSYATLHVLYP